MKRFLDVLKISLDNTIESFFSDVEVESILEDKSNNTLNFILISHNLIPYNYVQKAREELAIKLFDIDVDKETDNEMQYKNLVVLDIKYDLPDKYTAKVIFDEIRKDLFKEIKETKVICAALFRDDNVKFIDDDTIEFSFIDMDGLKEKEFELVEIIKNIFKKRYNKIINTKINWVDDVSGNTDLDKKEFVESNSTLEFKEEVKVPLVNNTTRSKNSVIMPEGDRLLDKKPRSKFKFVNISSILFDMSNIEVMGVIYNLGIIKPEGKDFIICKVFIYDGEGCIEVKFYGNKEDESLFYKRFKIGLEIRVFGNAKFDTYSNSMAIGPQGLMRIEVVREREVIEFNHLGDDNYHNIIITDREDNELEKRVELHLHTKSSMQDGVGEIKAYIDTATKFGMTAMAITDHGCVNALADAYEYLGDKKRPRKNQKFKIINGVEGYLVEDFETYYFDKDNNFSDKHYSIDDEFVIYEFATTGNIRKNNDLIKIEAIKIRGQEITGRYSEFIHTDKPISVIVRDNTSVKESDVENAKDLKTVLKEFMDFANGAVFVTANKNVDWMLADILRENGIENDISVIDLTILARLMLKNLKRKDLVSIAKELKIKQDGITDRKKTEMKRVLKPFEKISLESAILPSLILLLKNDYEIKDLSELKSKLVVNSDFIKRQSYYHIILLAKNDVGRVNLYKLVSDSSINYMYDRRPRMPRSLIDRYREGLIVGSACIAGEFMDAIRNGADDERLKEIANYYDYLEIQPTLNNSFLLNEDSENFKSIKDLENLNKKVIEIADEMNKIVVATCDCHYVEKSDKVFREVLRLGSSYKKSNVDTDGNLKVEVSEELESSSNEELYFRTTKEMLDEFAYLGVDKAREVVIKNTNLINNMIEDIRPIRCDKCPPHIEGSENELRTICYNNFESKYGKDGLSAIKNRLDNELNYIIDNGYSVMYKAAKDLIDFSNSNGYPVGSRGSVGSSFVATLLGISEVNPLKPYYLCPKCRHIEYETDETKKYENDTGFDMPDKKCPNCGTLMLKDGINIPFETFLGIPGDSKAHKEPDIDLNFCSVFQSNIHKYTIELFGKENTFKAGTVGTVKEKTAYGYVKKYMEQEKKSLTKEQITFYRNKILDCKTNTGQHPGGMIVVPKDEEIYTFTPIQLAADKDGNAVTTHFDYHKIEKNLLKLDILGHDSPLILKKLAELTNTNYLDVPFYEEEVLRLFKDTTSLGIMPKDISGTRLGCLSIPEFGTDFAMNMCEEAKPTTVADLIRIAGLAHGTDVWQGNAQILIKEGVCTLGSAICCRDDIMIYLISKGLDEGTAFNIMESVRKGRGLNNDWIQVMKEHSVPDWYIDCCKKIKYMFPKAHAAAYVINSLRIAYYKIHYPKEYYATYFSVKKDGIDYKYIMQNKEDITYHIAKIKKIINERDDNTTKQADNSFIKEYESMSDKNLADLYMVYRIVEEMEARGVEFCPIDIYEAKRSDFIVHDGKIMPSFDSISGIGTNDETDFNNNISDSEKSTAMRCELEGRKREYTSIDNFRVRTGVSKTIIDKMKGMGLFGNLKDTDQNTIFDYL